MGSPGASFLGGLVKTFGEKAFEGEVDRRKNDLQMVRNRIDILTAAANNPNLTDEAREAIMRELHDIASGKKPGTTKPGQDHPLQGVGGAATQIDQAHRASPVPPPPAPQGKQAIPGSTAVPVQGMPAGVPAPPQPPNSLSAMPGAQTLPQDTTQPAPQPQQLPAGPNDKPVPQPLASPQGASPVGAPPAPPQSTSGRMTLTHDELMQRHINDIVAQAKAESAAKREGVEATLSNIYSDLKDAGIAVDDRTKLRIIEQVHGVKITAGQTRFGRDSIPTSDIPDGSLDAVTHEPIDKSKSGFFREVWNAEGFQGYTRAQAPRPTAEQQKFNTKVEDAKSANPMKPNETPEDYQARIEGTVHRMAFSEQVKKLAGMGLRNELTAKNIERVQQEIVSGNGLSYKSAKVLWDGAWRAARQRKTSEIESFQKPVDDLVNEELNKAGTSYNEVIQGLKQSGTLPKPAAQRPAGGATGGVKTADDLAKKLKLAPRQ